MPVLSWLMYMLGLRFGNPSTTATLFCFRLFRHCCVVFLFSRFCFLRPNLQATSFIDRSLRRKYFAQIGSCVCTRLLDSYMYIYIVFYTHKITYSLHAVDTSQLIGEKGTQRRINNTRVESDGYAYAVRIGV